MADSRPSAQRAAPPRRNGSGYLRLSTRPLHTLVFLAPMIALYEIGSAMHLTDPDGAANTIRAKKLLSDFFRLFGVSGLYLPAAALVAALLVWHVIARDPWRIKPSVLGWMLLESAAWALPLLVFGQLLRQGMTAAAGASEAALTDLPWQARATVALGAGLYEELLFRVVAIAAAHFVLVDVLSMKEGPGRIAAVILAAAAFALYHDLDAGAGGIDAARLAFFFTTGLYFGSLYATRGFGIVAAAHALYDLAVLLL